MGASYLERAGQTAARHQTPPDVGALIGAALARATQALNETFRNFGILVSGGYTDNQYADAMLAEHRAAMKRQPRHRRSLADGGYVVGAPVVMAGGPCGPFGGPGPAAGASSVLIEGIRRRDLMRSVR